MPSRPRPRSRTLLQQTTAQRNATLVRKLEQTVSLPFNGALSPNTYRYIVTNPDQATTDGPLIPFCNAISNITGNSFDTVLEENVQRIERLVATNPNNNYHAGGRLRNLDGSACGHGVRLSAEAKNQLLGWGGEPVNIAWRDFIFRAYKALERERANLGQYLHDRQVVAAQGKTEHFYAVADLVRLGDGPATAEGKVVKAHGTLYKAMIPQCFPTATEAVCVAKGIPRTPANKKMVRNQTITANGTQSFHWERGRLVNRTRQMKTQNPNADYMECARAVTEYALEHEECRFRDLNGNPVSDREQVKLLFDLETDFVGTSSVPLALPAPAANTN